MSHVNRFTFRINSGTPNGHCVIKNAFRSFQPFLRRCITVGTYLNATVYFILVLVINFYRNCVYSVYASHTITLAFYVLVGSLILFISIKILIIIIGILYSFYRKIFLNQIVFIVFGNNSLKILNCRLGHTVYCFINKIFCISLYFSKYIAVSFRKIFFPFRFTLPNL